MREDSSWLQKIKCAIEQENAIPTEMEQYIDEIVDKLKKVCKSQYCTILIEEEIKVIKTLIRQKIERKKRVEIAKLENRRDCELGKIIEQSEENICKMGTNICKMGTNICQMGTNIWNTDEIIAIITPFLSAVKSWKLQSLAREGVRTRQETSGRIAIEGAIREIKQELFEKIEEICKSVIQRLVEKCSGNDNKQKMPEDRDFTVSGFIPGNDEDGDRH